MAAATRLYVATIGDASHLIEAANAAQVRAHVARKLIAVRVAAPRETGELMRSGVEIETVGEATDAPVAADAPAQQ